MYRGVITFVLILKCEKFQDWQFMMIIVGKNWCTLERSVMGEREERKVLLGVIGPRG